MWLFFLWFLSYTNTIKYESNIKAQLNQITYERSRKTLVPLLLHINPEINFQRVYFFQSMYYIVDNYEKLRCKIHSAIIPFYCFLKEFYSDKFSRRVIKKRECIIAINISYILDHHNNYLSDCIKHCHKTIRINQHLLKPWQRFKLSCIPIDGPMPNDNPNLFILFKCIPKQLLRQGIIAFYGIKPKGLNYNIYSQKNDKELISAFPVVLDNYYGYGNNDFDEKPISICPLTCRPYSRVSNMTWKEVSSNRFRCKVENMISLHRIYISYVAKYHEFPDRDNLLMYAYFCQVKKKIYTLPAQVEVFSRIVQNGYNELLSNTNISVDEFLIRQRLSMQTAKRIQIERNQQLSS